MHQEIESQAQIQHIHLDRGGLQDKTENELDESSQVKQLKAMNEIANASPQAQNLTQLNAIANGGDSNGPAALPQAKNNTGLPDQLKSGIENLGGFAMDDVKVHYNSSKPAQLQAHAYAQGTDIHLAPGQEKHLPHEAWHVVQQKQGRVKPTLQMKGIAINDDSLLETEADVMGDKAMGFGGSKENLSLASSMVSSVEQLQRKKISGSGPEVLQAMFIPYSRRDMGFDDTDVFADEKIGNVVFERSNHMAYTKKDGSNTGSIKHYVPYNWLMKNLADKWVIGYSRKDVHGNLKGILNVLGIPVPKQVNPTKSVIDFNTWVASAVYSICDWEENLFKDVPSSGDGRGTRLDTPNTAAVLARVEAARALLHSCSLDEKVVLYQNSLSVVSLN